MNHIKKYYSISVLGLVFLIFNIQSQGQCTLTSVDFEGFEYQTNCPDLIPGMTYHPMPKSYAVYSGSYSLYLNFINNLAPGTLVYERFYDVCPNQTYEVSGFFKESWSGQCNITLNVVDGSGVILDTWTGIIGSGAWFNWTSILVNPISNTMSFQLISNYMAGSNDLSMDDLELKMCIVPEFDEGSFEICQNDAPINLFDSLTLVSSSTGNWTGPSIPSGGNLGTFDPSIMPAGSYSYTVPGTSICPDSTAVISVVINPSPTPSIIVDVPFCDGGTVSLVDSGLYNSIVWSTTETTPTINVDIGNTYSVTVSDINNCEGTTSVLITLPPSDIAGTLLTTQVGCFGESTGAIDLVPSGGTAPYSYNWSNGSISEDLFNVAANTYTVTITDVHLCQVIEQIEVSQPNELLVNLSGIDLSCHGDTDAVANTVVSGGVLNYIYNWNTGAATSGLTNIPAGTYSVTVTDNNGCTATESIIFEEPAPIALYSSGDQTICLGTTANIVTNSFGGTLPYTYFWDPGGYSSSSVDVTPYSTTEYCVYISDANACVSNVRCITINVNPPLDLELSVDNDSICLGDTITLSSYASGGDGGPYIYELFQGPIIEDEQIIIPEISKKYIVIAYDNCGTPSVFDTINVVVSEAPLVSFNSDKIEGCEPLQIQFYLNYSEPEWDFFWNFNDGSFFDYDILPNPVHTFQNPGTFDIKLSVSNEQGCSRDLTIPNMIEVYEKPESIFETDVQNTTIADPVINFYNYSINATNSFWIFGDGDSLWVEHPPEHYYHGVGSYVVSLISESDMGCRDTSYQRIEITGTNTFYIPNAFNPYSSVPENRIFKPYGEGVAPDNYNMYIYNRWGELIFHSKSLETGWDGTSVNNENSPVGNYVYKITYLDFLGNRHSETGSVLLMY